MPPERSLIEHWLYRYDQGDIAESVRRWHGLRFAGGSFAPGAGARLGVGYDQRFGTTEIDRANRLAVSPSAHMEREATGGPVPASRFRNIASAPIGVKVNGEYYEYPARRLLRHGL